MRTLEQVFETYYASMTDLELLSIAKSRNSVVRIAQTVLAEELGRRQIAASGLVLPQTSDTLSLFTRLWHRIRREPARTLRAGRGAIMPASPMAREQKAQEFFGARRSFGAAGHLGATEDQVCMVRTLPERLNGGGTKIEDIAGTGEHDSLGG
jgi:hypothetical protein